MEAAMAVAASLLRGVPAVFLAAVAMCAAAADGSAPPPLGFCNNMSNCAQETKKGDAKGNHCASGQQMFALQDIGYGVQSRQRQWRYYAANNTNANHTAYRPGGRCYCT